MPNVGDTFLYNGAPTNGATVKLWPLSSFGVQPAQDTALPGGSPTYGPAVTAATSGGAGAWTLAAVTPGEYWASYEYAGHIAWAHLFVPAVLFPPQASYLVNGGMEVQQRTPASFSGSGLMTLDGWLMSFIGALTVSKITSTIGTPGSSAQLVYVHTTNGEIKQKVEDFVQLRGQTVTFAATIKANLNGAVHLYITDGTTVTYSSYNVGTGSQRLSVTAVIGAAAAQVQVSILCDVATCTVEANDATLVVGATPMDYYPLPAAEDLIRCQRRYEIMTAEVISVATGAGQNLGYSLPYKVEKGGTPTVTVVGTWTATNCGQPQVALRTSGEKRAVTVFAASVAAGICNFQPNSADDVITVEWNP